VTPDERRLGTEKQNFVLRSQVFGDGLHYLTTTSLPLFEEDYAPIMMLETIKYLRDIAQACTRLARACPDVATAHGLEEIAIDLMAKAKELEHDSGR